MTKDKFKLNFLLILGIVLYGLSSCKDNGIEEEPIVPPTYAQLSDVKLTKTINGQGTLELTTFDQVLTFSSQLVFNEKSINWSNPTLEKSFDKIFDLSKDNITVTNEQGNVSSVNITVENNNVKVSFQKINNSYDYLKSSTFTISVETKIKENVTEDETDNLNYSGFRTQSTFYIESANQNIKSNTVFVTSRLNPDALYDVKGDPNNHLYPYKVNIVYFVPADINENPGYRRRISTLLLNHQLFVMKWMEHWGYGAKSFGLPLDENGMVDLVVVRGTMPKSGYPYGGGGSTMIDEINQWYAAHGLTRHSVHTLVISATNASIDDTPFYGLGRWAFALDFPGMAHEMYNIDPITNQSTNNPVILTTSLIGGLFHEMHHGLNLPHVGNMRSQHNSRDFGTTLMGSGNQTYGKTPTFFQHSSAATLNTSQVSSRVERTFYNTTTASVNITDVIIDGGDCTVKGTFTASEKVTDVIVRFLESSESSPGGSSGYASVAFVTKPKADNTFDITIPIEERSHRTFDHRVHVTILMENGNSASTLRPIVYKLVGNATSGWTLETEDIISDGTWEVTVSHQLPQADPNRPEYLVDGNANTFLSLIKPGRTFEGISIPAGDVVWATVDFKKEIEFTSVVLTNRNFNAWLNTQAVTFYSSNDGVTFTLIKSTELPNATVNEVKLDAAVKYRYLKMTYDQWHASGSTMQFSQLGLKNAK